MARRFVLPVVVLAVASTLALSGFIIVRQPPSVQATPPVSRGRPAVPGSRESSLSEATPLAANVKPQSPTRAKPLICAVLAKDRMNSVSGDVGALLEVHLADAPEIALVDRDRIDAVLDEHTLAAAVGAAGLTARRSLGALFGAELLVILECADAEDQAVLRTTIAETRHGLRLVREEFPWDESHVEESVKHLADAVIRSSYKHGTGVETVCAVPAFVCEDLEYDYSHNVRAYATLVERTLMNQPDVLVVELDEAKALAQELAVSRAERTVRRTLPYYFFGRYRNRGRGQDRFVDLTLTCRRGDKQVMKLDKPQTPASEVGSTLQSESLRMLDVATAGTRPIRFDPQSEVALLVERAERLERLGQAPEAAGLLEAALLLNPGRADLHLALLLLPAKGPRLDPNGWQTDATGAQAHEFMRLGRAQLDRVGAFFRLASDEQLRLDGIERTMRMPCLELLSPDASARLPFSRDVLTQLQAQCAALVQDQEEILFDVLENRGKALRRNGGLVSYIYSDLLYIYRRNQTPEMWSKEKAIRIRALRAAGNARFGRWAMKKLLDVQRLKDDDLEAYKAFLDEVAAECGHEVAAAVREIRLWVEATESRRRERKQNRLADDASPSEPTQGSSQPEAADVEFEPLSFTVLERQTVVPDTYQDITSWMSIDGGPELIETSTDVYRITAPGVLKSVVRLNRRLGDLVGCHDGQYVWLFTGEKDKRTVDAIDVFTGARQSFTRADDLPVFSWAIATPISAGRVCVWASIGADSIKYRSWIAILSIRPDGNKLVRVIQEGRERARSVVKRRSILEVPTLDTAARPRKAVLLRDPANAESMRLVAPWSRHRHWLLIDPDTGSLEIREAPERRATDGAIGWKGAAYWLAGDRRPYGNVMLWRLRWPEMKATPIVTVGARYDDAFPRPNPKPNNVPYGALVFDDGRVHIVGHEWRVADGIGRPFRRLAARVPGELGRQVVASRHQGIVILTNNNRVFRAVFREDVLRDARSEPAKGQVDE